MQFICAFGCLVFIYVLFSFWLFKYLKYLPDPVQSVLLEIKSLLVCIISAGCYLKKMISMHRLAKSVIVAVLL